VQGPLSHYLDAAERSGKLNLRTADIAQALPGVSADALRQALHRQQRKGHKGRIVRTSRGSEHWFIVPLQDASAGAPPLETWLDAYLSKTLGLPYYVALLSAAEVKRALQHYFPYRNMNKAKLKPYAPQARKDFIDAVTARANLLGLSDKAGALEVEVAQTQGDITVIAGQAWPAKVDAQRKQLNTRIRRDSFAHTMSCNTWCKTAWAAYGSWPPLCRCANWPNACR
jgi:hypothetical protein